MDLIELETWLTISLFGFALAFFMGRIMDTHFRAKVMRSVMKKDYGVLAITSKDRKNIRKIVVNLENTILKIGAQIWIVQGGRIYRQEKPEEGFGFLNSKKEVIIKTIMEEGVPTLYVDVDSIKPLDFYPDKVPDSKSVQPEELGSFLMAWVGNQIMKGLNVIGEYRNFLLIIIVLSIIQLLIGYYVLDGLGGLKAVCAAAHTAVPAAAQNGTLVINGPGVG